MKRLLLLIAGLTMILAACGDSGSGSGISIGETPRPFPSAQRSATGQTPDPGSSASLGPTGAPSQGKGATLTPLRRVDGQQGANSSWRGRAKVVDVIDKSYVKVTLEAYGLVVDNSTILVKPFAQTSFGAAGSLAELNLVSGDIVAIVLASNVPDPADNAFLAVQISLAPK